MLRVMFGSACAVGLVVALIPGMGIGQTAIAMVLAGAGPLLWMLADPKGQGGSLHRSPRPEPSRRLILGTLVLVGVVLPVVVSGVALAVYEINLPEGIGLVVAVAIGGVTADFYAGIAERLENSLRTDEA